MDHSSRTIAPSTDKAFWPALTTSRAAITLRTTVRRHRRAVIAAIQVVVVVLSHCSAFWLRFDGAIPASQWAVLLQALPWLIVVRALSFAFFRLSALPWKYTGLSDLGTIIMAVVAGTATSFVIFQFVLHLQYSRSILAIDSLVLIAALTAIRLTRRIARLVVRTKGDKRVLIYGAGDAGEMIVRDMRSGASGYEPIGFIDDNPAKLGQRIHGVRVLGSRSDLARIIASDRPHELLVAIPSADASQNRALISSLRPYQIPISALPSVRDVLRGRVAVNQIRPLTIAGLLPRDPVNLDEDVVRRLIVNSRVMVTGAGGSIGAELCRQIASFGPSALVLYERYENTLHDLVNDLADRFGSVKVWPVVGDVTDSARVHQVLEQYRPQLVFHAAAHKHVPLMEHNPCEAVKNNVFGTATVAAASARAGVERFILISTDKAVNPSSVMGATKAVGELIVQMMSGRSATRFAAVRFGNVLGSNGSVLPRFLDQVREGGPVTVTHPEMRRFFMLIPEAVQLVLHAAALGESGVTYVLEMGEQIKLVDLARTVIRLTGFEPDRDIPIVFIGLRPGEKLFEELLGADETAEPSPVDKIMRVRSRTPYNRNELDSLVAELISIAVQGDSAGVIRHLRRMLPAFEPVRVAGQSVFDSAAQDTASEVAGVLAS